MHPLNYYLGFAAAAIKAGARIFEHSLAVELNTGAAPSAKTASGKVSAKFMVVAGNAYLGKLVGRLYSRLMPCGSFTLALLHSCHRTARRESHAP